MPPVKVGIGVKVKVRSHVNQSESVMVLARLCGAAVDRLLRNVAVSEMKFNIFTSKLNCDVKATGVFGDEVD